jgi:hypothetical protein
MEINKINGDILGVITAEEIPEGRMVILMSHSFSNDFGSQTDLPAVRMPQTADEGKRARHMIGWAVDNRQTPIFVSQPSYAYALRGGFGSAANVPFTSTVWLTWPGMKQGATITSGIAALAYGAGTYTVWSGNYISSAGLKAPGALVSVNYASPNQGKLQLQSTFDADLVVGKVVKYDLATDSITVTLSEY